MDVAYVNASNKNLERKLGKANGGNKIRIGGDGSKGSAGNKKR